MNGIGISATIFDTSGALYVDGSGLAASEALKNNARERRATRTATLDGGVSVYDTGYSAGDRDMEVKVPAPSRELIDFFFYMVETYNLIMITTEDGAYYGVPQRAYLDNDGAAVLNVAITEGA